MPRMSDLPEKLVGEKILTRVPITSVKTVRSTCKTWDAITKRLVVLGKKAAAADEFLGFVKMNEKVHSLRYHLEEEDLVVDVSVQQVDLLNELDISKLYHCDGLVLCVARDKELNPKLVLWNPYLCQTRWIGPRENFKRQDRYAIGYSEDEDKKRDHKILRFLNDYSVSGSSVSVFRCEIYDISSDSWRVLKVKPNWEIDEHQRGVSVKGNTYFFAHERHADIEPDFDGSISEVEDFLLCFDFTRERFGPRRLPLPFHSYSEDCVTLSNVRDEQLAVLFGGCESSFFDIWITLTVEPKFVSWSKFLRVETEPALNFRLNTFFGGSFFVDEENKVAVVFELDGYKSTFTDPHQHTAFVFGQAGYIQSVILGDALKRQYLIPSTRKHFDSLLPPLVCSSSYRPSLVQVNQPLQHKRKRIETNDVNL